MAKEGDSCISCIGLLLLIFGVFAVAVSGGLLAIPGMGLLIVGSFILCLPNLSADLCKCGIVVAIFAVAFVVISGSAKNSSSYQLK